MVEKIKFGTLYMDGQPQEVGGWYPTDEPALGLGNTVPGKEITWLKSAIAQNNGTSRTRHWFPVREPAVASAKTNLPRCISPGKKTRSPTNIEFKPLAYHPTGTQF